MLKNGRLSPKSYGMRHIPNKDPHLPAAVPFYIICGALLLIGACAALSILYRRSGLEYSLDFENSMF